MARRPRHPAPSNGRRLTLATAAAAAALLALPSLSSASILPRLNLLNGHSRHHNKMFRVAARQEDSSSSSSPASSTTASELPQVTLTVKPLPEDGATPTGATDTGGLGSLLEGLSFNGTVPIFPNVTVQEAVATVCPNATVLAFPLFSAAGTASADASSVSVTAAASASAAVSGVSDGNARVDVGSDGCQTLFTPTVKAVCETTISPLGIPVVTVTECEQWVTFSSETLAGLTASMPTVVPVVEATAGAEKRQEGAGTTGAVVSGTALLPLPAAEPSQGPGTYYAVKWYDAARGGVPASVRAVECWNDDVVGGGGACTTWEERWSETQVVTTVTEEIPITYSGVSILGCITLGERIANVVARRPWWSLMERIPIRLPSTLRPSRLRRV